MYVRQCEGSWVQIRNLSIILSDKFSFYSADRGFMKYGLLCFELICVHFESQIINNFTDFIEIK